MFDSSSALNELAHQLSACAGLCFLNDVQLTDGLLTGAIKNAAVIACSDMGCTLPYICSSGGVQLYLFQEFGHSVTSGGFMETVAERRIEQIIVYGHSDCEFLNSCADLSRYNVLDQIKQLTDHRVIGPAIRQGKLKVHGWFYHAASQQLEVFDPKLATFVKQSSTLVESELTDLLKRRPC